MEIRTIGVTDVPVNDFTTGAPDGSPLLLLHDTYSGRVWQPVLDSLAQAGHRPLAVDFPDFGRSGKPGFDGKPAHGSCVV